MTELAKAVKRTIEFRLAWDGHGSPREPLPDSVTEADIRAAVQAAWIAGEHQFANDLVVRYLDDYRKRQVCSACGWLCSKQRAEYAAEKLREIVLVKRYVQISANLAGGHYMFTGTVYHSSGTIAKFVPLCFGCFHTFDGLPWNQP